jgi:hypothetical protein
MNSTNLTRGEVLLANRRQRRELRKASRQIRIEAVKSFYRSLADDAEWEAWMRNHHGEPEPTRLANVDFKLDLRGLTEAVEDLRDAFLGFAVTVDTTELDDALEKLGDLRGREI